MIRVWGIFLSRDLCVVMVGVLKDGEVVSGVYDVIVVGVGIMGSCIVY